MLVGLHANWPKFQLILSSCKQRIRISSFSQYSSKIDDFDVSLSVDRIHISTNSYEGVIRILVHSQVFGQVDELNLAGTVRQWRRSLWIESCRELIAVFGLIVRKHLGEIDHQSVGGNVDGGVDGATGIKVASSQV